MSLKFVTRKLKTQTLGDDEGSTKEIAENPDNSGEGQRSEISKTEESIGAEGSTRDGQEIIKGKKPAIPTNNARSRRALRLRQHGCDDSESEEDEDREREPSKILRGKGKNATNVPSREGQGNIMRSNTSLHHPEFALPRSSTTSLPTTTHQQYKVVSSSVLDQVMLEDNYSSEEELKEIISSEKQRKRSGGGSVKDSKSKGAITRGDHHMRSNEEENTRKLSVKRGSFGADNVASCQSVSPSFSTSPSSGKMVLSSSRPSSGRNSKQARTTPSTALTNAAEKRKWSEVEYADYCCSSERGYPVCDINTCGKKTFVAGSGSNSSNLGVNVRCRANGTISAPPVPAVLMVRGSIGSGGYSARCESISRSGSSGCSSQHSCYGDDDDAYIGGEGVCCNLRSTPRIHNISRGSSAGGSGANGNRHSDVPTPVQFCTSPPLDVHRPTRSHGSRGGTDGTNATHIQSDAIPMPQKSQGEYGKDGSLFVTTSGAMSSGPSSSSPPPSKMLHFDGESKNDRATGIVTKHKPVPVRAKVKTFQAEQYTGKDNGENSERDADEEVENMMENSKPFRNSEFVSMDMEDARGENKKWDNYSEAMDEMTGRCNKSVPSKLVRGKEGQRCSRGLSLRSCKMKPDGKMPSTLRRRSHSQSRISSVHQQNYQDGFYHTHHLQRGHIGHLHRRRQTPSPSKRHRLTPRPPSHNGNTQRPSLDFEKMQQIKKRVITSWRPQGQELSLFCW